MGDIIVVDKDITSSTTTSNDFVVFSDNLYSGVSTTDFAVMQRTDTFQLSQQNEIL